MSYDIGDSVRLSAEITDAAGVDVDPTTVTCSVRKPDGTTASLSVTNDGTGLYHADTTLDQSGTWYYRFAGTGTVVVAEEGTFLVNRQRV